MYHLLRQHHCLILLMKQMVCSILHKMLFLYDLHNVILQAIREILQSYAGKLKVKWSCDFHYNPSLTF